MDSQKLSNSASVEECREFLVAVINSRPGFLTRYEGWFPRYMPRGGDEYEVLLRLYQRVVPLWVHPNVPLSEAPTNAADLYVLLLRHKLRVVWERALGHRNPAAAVRRLWAETNEFEHAYGGILRDRWMFEFTRRRAQPAMRESQDELGLRWDRFDRAMEWLQANTHQLMKCTNSDCRQNLHFIRGAPHQKFCSPGCATEAASKRVSQGLINKPEGISRLSPEGRARIVAGQKKRWDKFRKKMKSHSAAAA
jgi:hypothetical protein